MSHYNEDQLSEYALRRKDLRDRQAVEEHLNGCVECRNALAAVETFDAALRDPLPWELADAMATRREAPPQLLAQARAISTDDARARELVMPLIESPIRFAETRVADDRRFHTLAVVRLLCTIANKTHEHQPQYGLLLADTALAICAKLAEPYKEKSAWSLGTSWKERANALRYLGRFREAEVALDNAERVLTSQARPEPYDLAIVANVRAIVLCEMERFHEAIASAQTAAETFYEYGDMRRYLATLMLEGLAHYSADRDLESVQVMEKVAMAAREAGETDVLCRALANGANAYSRLHEYDKAAVLYDRAIGLMHQLDLTTECARIEWAMASLHLEKGDYATAVDALEVSRVRLADLGMVNDAALATLDLVAALLAIGDSERVAALCRTVSVTFSSEGMTRSSKKALAYLSEVVTSGHATTETVRHVRTFLERLPAHPHEEFQQLQ